MTETSPLPHLLTQPHLRHDKCRRLNLTIRRSTHAAISDLAALHRKGLSAFIGEVLAAYVTAHSHELATIEAARNASKPQP